MPLTADEIMEVHGAFDKADVSIIERIIYFNGWVSYEECGGILIFEGIDGSIQMTEYGSSVMCSELTEFNPREITQEEANEEIRKMDEFLATYEWPEF